MQCPKCKSEVDDNQTICPKCHKVLLLECPNCHSLGETPICQDCGYIILTKCAKCSKLVPTSLIKCPSCSYSVKSSLAMRECESDEFAAIEVKIEALNNIKKSLKSKELYSKFLFKLKNLLHAQLKGVDCHLIKFDDKYVINMNKELSFSTSAHKALRLAIKIVNAFVGLNENVIENFGFPLGLNLTIIKKTGEDFQELTNYKNNIKALNLRKNQKKYLKGFKIIFDQYVFDLTNSEYKSESLYTIENNGQNIIFYELLLDSYVLPPNEELKKNIEIPVNQNTLENTKNLKKIDKFSFKVFDINAKCKFLRISTSEVIEKLNSLDLSKEGKIVALRAHESLKLPTTEIIDFYNKKDYRVIAISCTEEMQYQPWSFLLSLFKDYFKIPYLTSFFDKKLVNEKVLQKHKVLFDLVDSKPVKAMTPEDARYTYMEAWGEFLKELKNTTILIDGLKNIDDTSFQALELYFDKFKKVVPNFIFITEENLSLHSKMKNLLKTNLYTEIVLNESSIESMLDILKSDAVDFIQSFYYEKIKENFNGSLTYFKHAINYLFDSGVLIDFDNKLIIKNKKSIILPKKLKLLIKSRVKELSANTEIAFIFAYFYLLGERLDIRLLTELGVNNIEKNLEILEKTGLVTVKENFVYLNDYLILYPVIKESLKKEAESFLVKNIVAKIGKNLNNSILSILLGKLELYKDEYLSLSKNSEFALQTGDYDAYLKNCLGFLSLIGLIKSNISKEELTKNKKEVFNNILLYLYSYSPKKIYFIEKLLLIDAINEGDNELIIKLSNLMLQGALLTSNYTEALGLLHNILSRMKNPMMLVNGAVNTKFLLLSLVNIEILYNIGDYKTCIEVANEILDILSPEILEKVKPASFSLNLFVSHIQETLRLVGFAKIFLLEDNFEEFFAKINSSLNSDLPEKEALIALKNYLAGKEYQISNMETISPFSKVIYLILQEFSILKDDYKRFAQNIYQAKLLAEDLHQSEMVYFCDLLIAYAYYKSGIFEKSESIYLDVIEKANASAQFNLLLLGKFFLALQKQEQGNADESMLLINDSLDLIRRFNNDCKIMYVLLEKLYIDLNKASDLHDIDIEQERLKIVDYQEDLKIFNI